MAALLGVTSTQAFLGIRPSPVVCPPSSLSKRGATTLHDSDAFLPRSPPFRAPQSTQHAGEDLDTLQGRLFARDTRRVILFDGECGFCSDVVNIFINFDGDPRGAFRFASLQGEIGQELLKANGMDTKHFNTIVLVDKEQVFTSSDAVLQIASRLKQPLPQLAKLAKAIIPHDILDALYHFVSSNRHLLAGEKDSCRIPSESEMERFLDQ